MLISHAQIKALQTRFGLSYKDAAHRLYMAELESVRTSDSASTYLEAIQARAISLVIEDIGPAILAIDTGEFDNITLKDGAWVPRDQT